MRGLGWFANVFLQCSRLGRSVLWEGRRRLLVRDFGLMSFEEWHSVVTGKSFSSSIDTVEAGLLLYIQRLILLGT